MSVLEIEVARPARVRRSAAPLVRPGHRGGRSTGPKLRPAPTPAPSVARSGATATRRACRVRAGVPSPALVSPPREASWRLTERGIAVVLVVVAMIAVAALAVVVPTALRVTGERYQPVGSSQLAR
jgi:hypothetical protein